MEKLTGTEKETVNTVYQSLMARVDAQQDADIQKRKAAIETRDGSKAELKHWPALTAPYTLGACDPKLLAKKTFRPPLEGINLS